MPRLHTKAWKRTLLKLGLCLLLGAIVNVAVAWGCANFAPIPIEGIETPDRALQALSERGVRLSDSDEVIGGCVTGFGLALETVTVERTASLIFAITTVGLPWHALNGEVQFTDVPDVTQPDDVQVLNGIELSTSVRPRSQFFLAFPYILPLKPIWPGFAINTIFYAALLWVLWIAPGRIRRLVRIRRGCCTACGYKIAPGGGIGPRCSECGHMLQQQASNASRL